MRDPLFDESNWDQIAVTETGAAASSIVDHTVGSGIVERVICMTAYHDDVAARNCYSTLIINGVVLQMDSPHSILATGADDRYQFYEQVPMPAKLELRAGDVLRWNCTSIGAGKIATMHLLLLRRKG